MCFSFSISALSSQLYPESGIVHKFFSLFPYVLIAGQLARTVYESMRREASCLRIQRDLRMYLAKKAYKDMCFSAVCIQTGMRGMAARNELRFRRETRASILIQVTLFFNLNAWVILKCFKQLYRFSFYNNLAMWIEFLETPMFSLQLGTVINGLFE